MANSYKELKLELENLKGLDKKPTLLLHSCCAPCSTHVLKMLNEIFSITIFYYNPNIYPEDEFIKRYNEQQKLIELAGLNIRIIKGFYDYGLYLNKVFEYKDLGERSLRCYNCYKFRLEETSKIAKESGFDYFTTTLSISPYKNSTWINEIGKNLESDNCKFLYSDFKKEEGYKESIKLAKEYDLYRQDYCGCEFSIKEHEEMLKNKK